MNIENARPLSDLVVVEVSGSISGAFCGKLLADLGARVIKIEPLAGDITRGLGPFAAEVPGDECSSVHLFMNSGKESLTLDIDHSDGQDIFYALLERVDAVLLSGELSELEGLTRNAEALSSIFSKLVITRITPFGSDGQNANWKSEDIIQYAMSGLMHMTGPVDGIPIASGGLFAATVPGLAAASATLMALHERDQSGTGQIVDISQQEVLILMQPYSTVGYAYTGIERSRTGMPFPMTIVPASDGYLGINVLTQAQWEGLCAFTGLMDLLEDPRFETPLGRSEYAWELTKRFAEWARDKQKADIFESGQQWRIPFGYVPRLGEISGLEQHKARGFFQPQKHPVVGGLMYPSLPFILDGFRFPVHRAPLRGEHTLNVLEGDLGIARDDVVRLVELGACL